MKFETTGSGKGDAQRPTDKKKYDENYIRVFGKECNKCKGKGVVVVYTPFIGEISEMTEPTDVVSFAGKHKSCPVCLGLGKVEK